ncbi:uncharacterized protein N0V89_002808 [Didymosphaeria variabile]|uniref:Uncharacterized protein n=1 Tax=Didymosphaeria variabile TaxID=1932322 RepID=A0A9W8XU72_9PLEO|nr:uncharacterized protein N0V89_002808 [Didymosphaeria variabile]KAJ4358228.1 hypothetical protein N0V89_002808 [Didymosphaeria variabile]
MPCSIIGISAARLPTLPGVVSSDDQPYTTVDATILGFVASVFGHVCAAVPTIRALVRLWCGSLDDSSSRSRPSRFGKGWDSSTALSGRRSSWLSKSGNSQYNHSNNLLSLQVTGKEKSADSNVQHHFGVQPVIEAQDSVLLSDLQPIRERAYQPSRPQRGVEHWNSGRPRWAPQEEQEPALIREPWKEADIDDSSSEKDILPDRGLARTPSVRAIEVHIQSMEARMAELEAEIQFYRGEIGTWTWVEDVMLRETTGHLTMTERCQVLLWAWHFGILHGLINLQSFFISFMTWVNLSWTIENPDF